EAQKLAFADRDAYYGDDENIPLDVLLSQEYAAQRRTLIAETASHEFRPGRVAGTEAFHPPLRTEYSDSGIDGSGGGVGEPTVRRNGE
ncbi:gamma-glutamyltransferase, partial [Escherichia coli]|nr:gamma-glutamyltransferase [Escherichia coli]